MTPNAYVAAVFAILNFSAATMPGRTLEMRMPPPKPIVRGHAIRRPKAKPRRRAQYLRIN